MKNIYYTRVDIYDTIACVPNQRGKHHCMFDARKMHATKLIHYGNMYLYLTSLTRLLKFLNLMKLYPVYCYISSSLRYILTFTVLRKCQ